MNVSFVTGQGSDRQEHVMPLSKMVVDELAEVNVDHVVANLINLLADKGIVMPVDVPRLLCKGDNVPSVTFR